MSRSRFWFRDFFYTFTETFNIMKNINRKEKLKRVDELAKGKYEFAPFAVESVRNSIKDINQVNIVTASNKAMYDTICLLDDIDIKYRLISLEIGFKITVHHGVKQ